MHPQLMNLVRRRDKIKHTLAGDDGETEAMFVRRIKVFACLQRGAGAIVDAEHCDRGALKKEEDEIIILLIEKLSRSSKSKGCSAVLNYFTT